MAKEKSVKLNALLNTVLQIANIIFPLITFPYVSRVLLVEANGRLSFCSSIVSYFSLFATLGLSTYGIKAVARVREDRVKLSRTVHELLFINLITTSISFSILVASLFIVPRFGKDWEVLLIYSINMLLNDAGLNCLYSGLEEYAYITKRSIIFKSIGIILMFIFVHSPEDYLKYALITVFSTTGGNILNIIYSKKYIDYKLQSNYRIKQHIKPTLAMFSTSLATSIYSSLDSIMIGFIIGDYEVGIYTAAVKVRTILSTLVTSVGSVLLPRMSYYVANQKWDEFRRLLKKSYSVLIMLSIPTSVYFLMAAKPSIILLSGKVYLDSVIPMQILMPIVIISSLVNITGLQILIPIGGEWKYTISVTCGALADLMLNLFLIPHYGAIGAAFATLIAEVIEIIIQMFYVREYIKDVISIKATVQVLVGTALGAVGFVIVNSMIKLNALFTLAITALVFFGIFALFLMIVKYEMFYEMIEMLMGPMMRRKR